MLKVGKIEYINTIPVYYGFIKGTVKCNCTFIEDVPSELNRKLREGELDISVVSSFECLKNSNLYIIFPDVSISSIGKVMSVLFFSQLPIHQLHRKDVWLTKSSMTSKALIEFLLREKYGIEPNYKYYSLKEGNLPKNATAVLSIGDEAFKIMKRKNFKFIYDLGEEWFNMYQLPFVFALWAVRRNAFEERQKEVKEFHEKLIESKKIGISMLDEICKTFSKRASITESECMKYYRYLNYDLKEEHIESLKVFSEILNLKYNLVFMEV